VNTRPCREAHLLVTDQFGNPVESVTVTFNVASGGWWSDRRHEEN